MQVSWAGCLQCRFFSLSGRTHDVLRRRTHQVLEDGRDLHRAQAAGRARKIWKNRDLGHPRCLPDARRKGLFFFLQIKL